MLANLNDQDRRAVNTRKSGSNRSDMAALTRAFPRAKVLSLWKSALEASVTAIVPEHITVLVCHLTLYRSDRSEFYSTAALIASVLGEHGLEVTEVIQLIDDVFDMYERLNVSSGALNAESGTLRWRSFSLKALPAAPARSNAENLSLDKQTELETCIQTLTLLLNWRHQEALSAESLAHALGARFTVLGVKHPYEVLRSLVQAPDNGGNRPRTVYVSHPISAYRRDVNQKLLSGANDGDLWADGVRECNEIPALVGEDGQLVGIMPTAIDELRFYPLRRDAKSLVDRSPYLGPRWPLMQNGVGLIATGSGQALFDDDVEHRTAILAEDSPIATEVFTGELTRFLEGFIFNEIPYRDHLIVANSDALLVHRPFADRARLSSGVEHEVRHWRDRQRNGEESIRLVILHSSLELRQLSQRWLGAEWIGDDNARTKARNSATDGIGAYAKQYLGDDYELELAQSSAVLEGTPLDFEHLGGRLEFSTHESVLSLRKEAVVEGFTRYLLERLALLPGMLVGGVCIFLLPIGVLPNSATFARVREFLAADDVEAEASVEVLGSPHQLVGISRILAAQPVMHEFFGLDVDQIDAATQRQLGKQQLSLEERLAGRMPAACAGALTFYERCTKEEADT